MKEIISSRILGFLALVSLILFYLCFNTRLTIRKPWYKEKIKAARLMLLAEETIKREARERKIIIDKVNDPNESGLIGDEQTLITTDQGVIGAKLTTLNPNFAAVVVDMIKNAGLQKGDIVAVGFTGSMPALNIAVLSAITSLELNPIIISSVGASSFGANNPDFTWLDMEKLLYDKKIFHFKSLTTSLGGGKDIGRGLSEEGRMSLLKAIQRNKIQFLKAQTLEDSINKRISIYDKFSNPNKIKLYINVGGGLASLGATINGMLISPGLSLNLARHNYPIKGVIIKMAERGIPVIHLLEVERIARAYGLPIAPVPLPEIGEGKVFEEEKHNIELAVLCSIFLIGLLFVVVRLDIFYRAYLKIHPINKS